MKVHTEAMYNDDVENNANVPQGTFKHSHWKCNEPFATKRPSSSLLNVGTALTAAVPLTRDHYNNFCLHRPNNPHQKPPLLETPSADVIQKRLQQLTSAFSRTKLSSVLDFSSLNNGSRNTTSFFPFGHLRSLSTSSAAG